MVNIAEIKHYIIEKISKIPTTTDKKSRFDLTGNMSVN